MVPSMLHNSTSFEYTRDSRTSSSESDANTSTVPEAGLSMVTAAVPPDVSDAESDIVSTLTTATPVATDLDSLSSHRDFSPIQGDLDGPSISNSMLLFFYIYFVLNSIL